MFSTFHSRIIIVITASLLCACSFTGPNNYYQNDGPPIRKNSSISDVIPTVEPFYKPSLRPYTVLGKRYVPITTDLPLVQEGIGSWYGKQFHGNKTSTGEIYDMFSASAAHPTMPLPSYARVTNLENGRSIIVRVNDRGPFLHNRVIDLSYAAANALGYASQGTARVRVERLTNDLIASGTWKNSKPVNSIEIEKVPSLETPATISKPLQSGWGAQIGSFESSGNAAQFAAHAEAVLAGTGQALKVRIVQDNNRFCVIVGEKLPIELARNIAMDVGSRLGIGAFAVRK